MGSRNTAPISPNSFSSFGVAASSESKAVEARDTRSQVVVKESVAPAKANLDVARLGRTRPEVDSSSEDPTGSTANRQRGADETALVDSNLQDAFGYDLKSKLRTAGAVAVSDVAVSAQLSTVPNSTATTSASSTPDNSASGDIRTHDGPAAEIVSSQHGSSPVERASAEGSSLVGKAVDNLLCSRDGCQTKNGEIAPGGFSPRDGCHGILKQGQVWDGTPSGNRADLGGDPLEGRRPVEGAPTGRCREARCLCRALDHGPPPCMKDDPTARDFLESPAHLRSWLNVSGGGGVPVSTTSLQILRKKARRTKDPGAISKSGATFCQEFAGQCEDSERTADECRDHIRTQVQAPSTPADSDAGSSTGESAGTTTPVAELKPEKAESEERAEDPSAGSRLGSPGTRSVTPGKELKLIPGDADCDYSSDDDGGSVGSFDSTDSDTCTYVQFLAIMLGREDWRTAGMDDEKENPEGIVDKEIVRIMRVRKLEDGHLDFEERLAKATEIHKANVARMAKHDGLHTWLICSECGNRQWHKYGDKPEKCSCKGVVKTLKCVDCGEVQRIPHGRPPKQCCYWQARGKGSFIPHSEGPKIIDKAAKKSVTWADVVKKGMQDMDDNLKDGKLMAPLFAGGHDGRSGNRQGGHDGGELNPLAQGGYESNSWNRFPEPLVIDPGASATVFPRTWFTNYKQHPSDGSQSGEFGKAANGGRIYDEGQKTLQLMSVDGSVSRPMCFQVADVGKALGSASRIVKSNKKQGRV